MERDDRESGRVTTRLRLANGLSVLAILLSVSTMTSRCDWGKPGTRVTTGVKASNVEIKKDAKKKKTEKEQKKTPPPRGRERLRMMDGPSNRSFPRSDERFLATV